METNKEKSDNYEIQVRDDKTLKFINNSIKVHGNKYDYSKVKYINSLSDVIIICKKHDFEFPQNPTNHLAGTNCPKCGLETRSNKRKTPINDFINNSNIKYNNKFDYSKVIYKNSDTHIIIICPDHGEFSQTPYHHLKKSKFGCEKCAINICSKNKTFDNNKYLNEIKNKIGDKFDYSKTNYINSNKDVTFICKEHNMEFSCRPHSIFKSKFCCPKCVTDNKKVILRKDINKFIEDANKKHNNRFDYSKVEYINTKTDIIIICPDHGEIIQTPAQHLISPTGCQKCSGKYKRNTEEFIIDAIKIHGDKYDYLKVEYINSHTDVIIYCKKHKIYFNQTPSMHISGSRCKICGDEIGSEKRKYTKEEFLTMAKEKHINNLDDYSLIDYVNINTRINIKCNIHGLYLQLPSDHLGGHRCSHCGKDKLSQQFRLSLDEFIKRSNKKHNNLYDYSKVEYKNTDEKVKIICNKHGIFIQTPHNHLNGVKCPTCKNKTESKLFEKLKIIYPSLIHQFAKKWCKNKNTNRCLPYDFVIIKNKLIIELDGLQHFKQISNWQSPEEAYKNDLYKMKCAYNNGYSIIRLLQEDVYSDKYDWLSELKDSIEKIKKDKKVQNIYMCKNNEYESFKNIDFNKITDSDLSDENDDDDIDSEEELEKEFLNLIEDD